MDDVIFQSLDALINGLKTKQFSSVELTQSYIQRTKAVEPKVGAFLSFDEDKTLKEAQASDKRRAEGTLLSELDGIPIGLKDIFAEKGQPLTCASRILEHFISPYDATLVQHLREAGMVLWGRLNMDEFAMGSSSEHSAFKMTHNPWDLTRIPGGSSSGSAAAVASGEVPLALGTDTGGSIRQPAALCGVVGIKPSYGRISRYGMVAFASSLDQAGVFARTVSGAARILSILCGADPKDATSARKPVPNFLADMQANKGKQWTLGVSDAYFQEGLNPEIRQSVEQAIEFYKSLGYRIVPIQLKTLDYAIPVYYVIASAEASSNLARFDGIRYGYRSPKAQTIDQVFEYSRGEGLGPEVKRRILLGLHVLSSGKYDAYYYDKAQKVRRLIYNDFMDAFKQVDAILAPTTPVPANKQGEKDTPLAMYLSDIYTVSVNLAGLPGMSIPCGFTQNTLPIGMQLIGKPFEESTLLSIAEAFEAGHDYSSRYPSL
ncbi:MAG: Asp-tRNA(Asn)/Glu-tRNA(Gln) amidotransferase subunit GatA [Opitutales bacterium]|nr:Asp-tRNA(Asn)/Glu-tRNA(Gln) amidotransferase subunit GatA [Opitutales bacterium]